MGRTFAVVALATAGAIGLAFAVQSLTDGRVNEMQARPRAEATSQPPNRPATAADESSQRAAETLTNAASSRAPEGVDTGEPADVDSPPEQPASNDGRARLADARPDAASDSGDLPVSTRPGESSLSAKEVHDFFVEGDACLVLGDTASRNARCKQSEVLAEQIVAVPKTSEDSWAYGMEYELDRRLTELAESTDDRAALKRKAVRCNAAGCLVYVEGSGGWSPKLLRMAARIRGDADIAQLNDNGRWPRADLWSHWVGDRAMIVLPR